MRHYYETVDGWFGPRVRPALDKMLASLPSDRPSTFVQIGTWVGRATSYLGVEIINSGKPITLIAIDHFKGSEEIRNHKRAAGIATSYETFLRNVQPVADALGDRFRVIVSDSADAARQFADDSLEAVWIDAAHGYEYVARDLAGWQGKVSLGGLLGGDDFTRCDGVARAVTERFGAEASIPGTVYWMVRRGPDGRYRAMTEAA
jgi:hypothetical protein